MFNQLSPKGNVAEFDWNTEDAWSIISTYFDSNEENINSNNIGGGGNLHIFRPLDLICCTKELAIQKLNLTSYFNSTNLNLTKGKIR